MSALKIPTSYVVILRSAQGKSIGQHMLDLPGVEIEDRYQQLTAFQTFMQRELARSQSARPLVYCTFTDIDWAVELKILKEYTTHKSVWSLFTALDYDHKKQEYL